jgi:hypothetical protein
MIKGPALRIAPTLILPKPFYALEAERLYYYLDALWQRRALDGCVLEVGCWLGGTAATAHRFLTKTGRSRRYVCIDTFDGFVPEQFQADLVNGTRPRERKTFQTNSKALVRKLLDYWDAPSVELVQGDIVRLPDKDIPPESRSAARSPRSSRIRRIRCEHVVDRRTPFGELLCVVRLAHSGVCRNPQFSDGHSRRESRCDQGSRDDTGAAVLFSLDRPSRTNTESTAAKAMTEAI